MCTTWKVFSKHLLNELDKVWGGKARNLPRAAPLWGSVP